LPSKYKTVAFDSIGELARLYFSFDMKKTASDMDTIRALNNYNGTTERLNMLIRRCKNLRDQGGDHQGVNVVFIAHEQIEKVYAKGGMITAKGQAPQEPIAIKGLPDMPGKQTPEEVCRAADNVFRVRALNGQIIWRAIREPVGGGGDYWEAKARFDCKKINNGFLPVGYNELFEAAKKAGIELDPAYIWILYGTIGMEKTRSLLKFPRPIKIFDLDHGTVVIKREVEALRKAGEIIDIVTDIDVEETTHYEKFVSELEATFG